MKATSLRTRLLTLIMTPLLMIACGLGVWRYSSALTTAEELFDRSLLSSGLAISRDVALSGGDALSALTRDQLRASAGGEVYYHVFGPDLTYTTGYAYPPAPPREITATEDAPIYYRASHRGEIVRAIRIAYPDPTTLIPGLSTVTVWQRGAERRNFAETLAMEAALSLAILVAAVGAIVWFGVDRGLKPLEDLQEAISSRTSDDLNNIARPVPREVLGVVGTLNSLFGQVREALAARNAFISDAAHQLRNPAAAVLSLAEAAERSGDDVVRAERIADLRIAAERMARLTTQLLSLERLDQGAQQAEFVDLDLAEVARNAANAAAVQVIAAAKEIEFESTGPVMIEGDEVLLAEAILNLIDNSLVHGGDTLTRISVALATGEGKCRLSVSDDGRGLTPDAADIAFSRFGQIGGAQGSGLGLAITKKICELHGAEVVIAEVAFGARIELSFPLSGSLGALSDVK